MSCGRSSEQRFLRAGRVVHAVRDVGGRKEGCGSENDTGRMRAAVRNQGMKWNSKSPLRARRRVMRRGAYMRKGGNRGRTGDENRRKAEREWVVMRGRVQLIKRELYADLVRISSARALYYVSTWLLPVNCSSRSKNRVQVYYIV